LADQPFKSVTQVKDYGIFSISELHDAVFDGWILLYVFDSDA